MRVADNAPVHSFVQRDRNNAGAPLSMGEDMTGEEQPGFVITPEISSPPLATRSDANNHGPRARANYSAPLVPIASRLGE